jgi:hypothetical protein
MGVHNYKNNIWNKFWQGMKKWHRGKIVKILIKGELGGIEENWLLFLIPLFSNAFRSMNS